MRLEFCGIVKLQSYTYFSTICHLYSLNGYNFYVRKGDKAPLIKGRGRVKIPLQWCKKVCLEGSTITTEKEMVINPL